MDLWTDCLARLVGAAIAVSTIFFTFGTVLIESEWTTRSADQILYREQ